MENWIKQIKGVPISQAAQCVILTGNSNKANTKVLLSCKHKMPVRFGYNTERITYDEITFMEWALFGTEKQKAFYKEVVNVLINIIPNVTKIEVTEIQEILFEYNSGNIKSNHTVDNTLIKIISFVTGFVNHFSIKQPHRGAKENLYYKS